MHVQDPAWEPYPFLAKPISSAQKRKEKSFLLHGRAFSEEEDVLYFVLRTFFLFSFFFYSTDYPFDKCLLSTSS